MNPEFDYILQKISNAKILDYPFLHLDIKNFLSDEHLKLILNENQVHFNEVDDHDELKNKLLNNGWAIHNFPGCVNNWKEYTRYLKKSEKYNSLDPVQRVGITFRLKYYQNEKIRRLVKFMNGASFHSVLRKKFNIIRDTSIISAIQKNLTGYEISPHPDVRGKCLTYLLNINNNEEIEKLDCIINIFPNSGLIIQV